MGSWSGAGAGCLGMITRNMLGTDISGSRLEQRKNLVSEAGPFGGSVSNRELWKYEGHCGVVPTQVNMARHEPSCKELPMSRSVGVSWNQVSCWILPASGRD